MSKRSNNDHGSFWLLIDTTRYVYHDTRGTGGAAEPTGTFTINVLLTAGQIVRVENNISTEILGTNSDGVQHSWFTGFMLYQL